jgi:hypothetical protein
MAPLSMYPFDLIDHFQLAFPMAPAFPPRHVIRSSSQRAARKSIRLQARAETRGKKSEEEFPAIAVKNA